VQPQERQWFALAAANKRRFPSSPGEIVQYSVAIASRHKRAVLAAALAAVDAVEMTVAADVVDATNPRT
jgi:hypothetical protein